MAGIFISYRRDDSRHAAGRLADELAAEFGAASIFRDVESIAPGVDFEEALDQALSACAVMLVVIGPRWLSITDAEGRRRLEQPGDWIRTEVARALERKVRLIPVMLEQGRAEEEAALTLGASGWRTFLTVTLPNIRWALLYGVLLCNARAMGEFGAVAVVSGKIRGQTTTMPLMIEMFYNEYLSVAAFTMAGVLALLAFVTLALKSALEWRYADQLAATHRH